MRRASITVVVLLSAISVRSFDTAIKSYDSTQADGTGFADVNGTRLYYEIAGRGETLVLIHGSFGDRRHWDLQFNELSEKYRVLRYDVRGYGKSALPKPQESYRDSEDLKALLQFLGISRAHICGLSMGSIIAIDFALSYPEKCVSLIAIGPRVAGDGSPKYRTAHADTVSAVIAKATDLARNKGPKEATEYLWTGTHALSRGIAPTTLKALLEMGYEYTWWRYLNENKREQAFPMAIEQLKEIKIPTLVVTAEHDLGLCKEVAATIVREIPGAKLLSIPGGGHIMNMDRPDEFNMAICKFIDEVK